MAWRTIADSEVDPESPVTTSLAQAWRDNPIAIAQGLSGATRIVYAALNLSNDLTQGDIADNAIGQGELNTTTTIESRTSIGNAIRTGSWGQYGFMYESRLDSNTSGNAAGQFLGRAEGGATVWAPNSPGSGNTGYDPKVTLFCEDNNISAYVRVRYIQASPPYNLGDGEVGLFVTVDVMSNGDIAGVSLAPDPVWAHNGPTNITPTRIDKLGRKFKRIRRPGLTEQDVREGRADMAEFAAAFREAPIEEIEITNDIKNADMALYPHSWVSGIGGKIHILDPVNTHELLAMHEEGVDIAELIAKGYIQLSNNVIERNAPPGVLPISFKWRNTR